MNKYWAHCLLVQWNLEKKALEKNIVKGSYKARKTSSNWDLPWGLLRWDFTVQYVRVLRSTYHIKRRHRRAGGNNNNSNLSFFPLHLPSKKGDGKSWEEEAVYIAELGRGDGSKSVLGIEGGGKKEPLMDAPGASAKSFMAPLQEKVGCGGNFSFFFLGSSQDRPKI